MGLGNFSIDTGAIAKRIEEQRKITEEINRIAGRIGGIADSQVFQTEAYCAVRGVLRSLQEEVQNKGKQMQNMSTVLEEIKNEYEKTEEKIVRAGTKAIKNLESNLANKGKDNEEKKHTIDWKKFLKDWDTLQKELEKEAWYTLLDLTQLGWELSQGFTQILEGKITMEEWMLGFIQKSIHDESVLYILALAAAWGGLDKKTVEQHLAENRKAWEQENGRGSGEGNYIEYQTIMGYIQYGIQNDTLSKILLKGKKLDGSKNICEVAAAYNALLYLNDGEASIDFPELLAVFESSGIMLDGYIGTAPNSLQAFFMAADYDTALLSGSGITPDSIEDMQEEYDTYILTFYNDDSNIMGQVHTMSVTLENGKYTMHNDYAGTQKYDSLEDAVRKYNGGTGKPISMIGIR